MENNRFSQFVENTLSKAGWFPGRNMREIVAKWKLDLMEADSWEMFSAAENALLEFGGIKVDQKGAGRTVARAPFELNPKLAIYESDRFANFEDKANTKLYPLGEAAHSHYFLAIGQDGRVFLIMDDIKLIGACFDNALENLIIGIKAQDIE